jgi:hypothetical protein
MALPTIVPTGFAGDYTDFLKTKVERNGAVRRSSGSVSVPGTTAAATLIGLFPFNAGMSFAGLGGFNIYTADLDSGTTVTLSVGVAYQDANNGTDVLTLVTSASTAAQAAGYIAPSAAATWQDYVTTGNGWVVVSVTAGPTTTTGSVTFNIPFAYDQPSLVA